jgi:Asp-tRNA(Asn)/Glu-tRNA(Gln) amidotransferase A subunit family amidase
MEQAKQADSEIAKGKYRGPLHGIPYGLKDLFAVKGTKTTWGAAPYKDQVIETDAYVVYKIKRCRSCACCKIYIRCFGNG